MTQRTHRWSLQDGGPAGEYLATGGSLLWAPATVKASSGEPLAPGTASAVATVTGGHPPVVARPGECLIRWLDSAACAAMAARVGSKFARGARSLQGKILRTHGRGGF
jgi:hypothetical protein